MGAPISTVTEHIHPLFFFSFAPSFPILQRASSSHHVSVVGSVACPTSHTSCLGLDQTIDSFEDKKGKNNLIPREKQSRKAEFIQHSGLTTTFRRPPYGPMSGCQRPKICRYWWSTRINDKDSDMRERNSSVAKLSPKLGRDSNRACCLLYGHVMAHRPYSCSGVKTAGWGILGVSKVPRLGKSVLEQRL